MVLTVGLAQCAEACYPRLAPFSPSVAFPEMAFLPPDSLNHQEDNQVYAAIRQSLHLAGLDAQRFGSAQWNPLGECIQPGDRVLLKPNWVLHEYSETARDCMVTHGAVIRAVLDYVYRAGGPSCHITVADAPEQAANWGRLLEQTGMRDIVAFYQDRLNCTVQVCDLRTIASDWDDRSGFFPPARRLSGDPQGYAVVDLGDDSELEPVTRDGTRFGIAHYSLEALQERHRPGRHQYLVAQSVLQADAVISIPKMKTHQKAGLTGGIKNLVGINGCKDWLPHYRLGGAQSGGDEYPEGAWWVGANRAVKAGLQRRNRLLWNAARSMWQALRRFMSRPAQLPSGAWHGNDTTWRMALDLNKILNFADRNGHMSDHQQRRSLCVVDGVIAGQGDGPLSPTAKAARVILAGQDVVAVDVVIAQLMGYDWRKVPLLARFLHSPGRYWFTRFDGQDVQVMTKAGPVSFEQLDSLDFVPPPGWLGHVERQVQ